MAPLNPSLVVVVTTVGNVNINVTTNVAVDASGGGYWAIINNILKAGGVWVLDANNQPTVFALLSQISKISVA